MTKGSGASKSKSDDTTKLKHLLNEIESHIETIHKTEKKINQNIDKEEKKLYSTEKEEEKMQSIMEIHGLKMNSFTDLQEEVSKIAPLLDEVYTICISLGGGYKEEILNLCQDLSHGYNLEVLEANIKKLKKHI
jgi:hypothetical protein